MRTVFLACVLATFLLLAPANAAAADAKPNILFLFADDLCADAIGAMGNDEVRTPNIDRLAQRGMTFTRAYNMGSWHGAVCMPSRGMLNTGRFLWDYQKVDGKLDAERQAGRVWSHQLRSADYRTYFAGKWHVRADAKTMFDVVGTVRAGMPDVGPNKHPHAYNRPRAGVTDTWNPADPKEGGFWAGGKHWSEVLADETVGFLGDAGKSDKPFFMYVAFNAPHDPRQAPQEYLDMYPADKIKVPKNFLPEYPYQRSIGLHNLRDEILGPIPRTEHVVQVHRREYYALITHMDAQIGRVLDALEKSGKADNTWIIFTADHGLAVGQHGLLGKQNLYEHSVRPPFIVVGPGVPQGKRTGEPIYYQDVVPTTLELAGIKQPEHVQFQSLLPIIRDQGKSKYPSIYTAYIDLQRAVNKDGWKLILYPKIKKIRLFHVTEDPHEMHDLAEAPGQAGRIRELFAELTRWQKETGDALDLKAAYPAQFETALAN